MINNSLFKLEEIPDYHPIAEMYDRDEWWREIKKRCIEGYWVSGKWMPPELYYYINFHNIKFESDEGVATSIGLPWLRDIDWEKAYIYTEACGFSGFEKDTKNTCHRWYGPEKDRAIKYGKITKEEADSKNYIPAREYLRRNHGESLGRPLYYNSAKNVIDLEGRGGGKSYWASACIAHNFLFDGARNYNEHLKKRREGNPYVSDTVVGAIDAKYSNDLLSKVKVGIENLAGKKIISNNYGETEIHPSPLSVIITGSLAPGRNWKSNTESILNHRTFQDNPLAANGTRPNRVFLEEVGFMNNLIESWGAIEATQAAAQHKRLVIYGLGTGGLTTAGAALYSQEIFYNPEEYNCLVFEDTWENKGNIGFFLPAYLTRNEFKEGENMITNVDKAKMSIEEEIEDAKKGNSKVKLLSKIINNPRVPSEIFLRQEGVFFPVQELKQALADLESNSLLLKSSYKVELIEKTKGRVDMLPSDKDVITSYPLRKSEPMDACVEIYQKPKLDQDGRVFNNRYIMATDPVDDDGNDDITRSLQSTFVFDTWTDEVVAEYTARTYLAKQYYENVRMLCVMFNARNLYENNKKGLHGHFSTKNSTHYLAETPQILKDQDFAKGGATGNRALGVNMNSEKLKLYGIELSLNYLEKASYRNPEKKNLYTIRSIGLLKEFISYSLDVNADRVSAFMILMIYRAELEHQIESYKSNKVKNSSNSEFWGRAYKKFSKDKVHSRLNKLVKSYDEQY